MCRALVDDQLTDACHAHIERGSDHHDGAAARCVVVVVRDDGGFWRALADALMTTFVVRLATTAAELAEQLDPIERVSCVCVVNDGVRLRDVHEMFLRAGGAAERLVFVSEDDIASPVALDEVLRVVRRLVSLPTS